MGIWAADGQGLSLKGVIPREGGESMTGILKPDTWIPRLLYSPGTSFTPVRRHGLHIFSLPVFIEIDGCDLAGTKVDAVSDLIVLRTDGDALSHEGLWHLP